MATRTTVVECGSIHTVDPLGGPVLFSSITGSARMPLGCIFQEVVFFFLSTTGELLRVLISLPNLFQAYKATNMLSEASRDVCFCCLVDLPCILLIYWIHALFCPYSHMQLHAFFS
jgi:hypothetical protein